MRFTVLAAILIVPALHLHAEGIEDRLLEGEILEVSKGDLEKAMAIYKTIHADEKAPESVRARSLLYLARCQRKLGEIEAAKKTLDELVKAHAKEEEVLRQARSFLKELETGKSESPRFDWLQEMEKSPEVQAKTFDLVMDLALSPDGDEHKRAMRQLRALGTLSVPVMERVMETSRDSTQRSSIAILLAQMGRYDQVPTILEADVTARNPLSAARQYLLARLPDLDERVRKDFLTAVERARDGPQKDLTRRLCLLAGAKEDLDPLLRGLEREVERWTAFSVQEVLSRIAARDPDAARALAARIVDAGCPAPARRDYFDVLKNQSPVSLGADQWVAHLEKLAVSRDSGDQDRANRLVRELAAGSRFDILARLAAGPARDAVRGIYWSEPRDPSKDREGKTLPEIEWAPVLVAAKDWKGLHLLAEVRDEAIGDLVKFLRDRAALAPDYVGCQQGGNCWHAARWIMVAPSPAFVEAMIGLLDVQDPVALAIALESLSLGKPEGVAPAFPAIERLAREAPDDRIREVAIYTLLRAFGKDPGKGPAALRALFDEFRRRSAAGDIPESYARSPLFGVEQIGFVSMKPHVSEGFADTLGWTLVQAGDETRAALYPAMLEAANATGGSSFEQWFAARESRAANMYPVLVTPFLEPITSPDLMGSVTEKLLAGLPSPNKQQVLAPRVEAFLRRVANEKGVPLALRVKVFKRGGEAAWAWFDWPVFFKGDDPLADVLARELLSWFTGRSEEEKQAVFGAALESPRGDVRKAAVGQLSLEGKEAANVLQRALDDREWSVRNAALGRLKGITRVDVAPVFHGLLASPHADVRLGVIEALIRFSDPKSIEPIVKLLDDPDINVRAKALEAVKEIRKTLEERKQWKEWAQGAAKQEKEERKD